MEDEGMGSGGYEGNERHGSRREGGMGGMGGSNGGMFPKPVKVGDIVDVAIEATASKGDGIAKKNGFVIFVNGAKTGENLKVRITDVKARFAIGEKVE